MSEETDNQRETVQTQTESESTTDNQPNNTVSTTNTRPNTHMNQPHQHTNTTHTQQTEQRTTNGMAETTPINHIQSHQQPHHHHHHQHEHHHPHPHIIHQGTVGVPTPVVGSRILIQQLPGQPPRMFIPHMPPTGGPTILIPVNMNVNQTIQIPMHGNQPTSGPFAPSPDNTTTTTISPSSITSAPSTTAPIKTVLPPKEEYITLEPPKLELMAAQTTTLQIRWNLQTHATKYVIERLTGSRHQANDETAIDSSSTTDEVSLVYDGPATSTLISQLQPNLGYSFRIRAIGGKSEPIQNKKTTKNKSAYSTSLAATTEEPPTIIVAADSPMSDWIEFSTKPLSPPDLMCDARSKNSLKLSWKAELGAQQYLLYFIPASIVPNWTPNSELSNRSGPELDYSEEGLDAQNTSVILACTPSNIVTYQQKGLKPGHTYHFAIKCLGSEPRDDSPCSSLSSFTTAPAIPNPPNQISRIQSTPNSITLQWSPSVDNGAPIVDYTLQKCESSSSSSSSQKDSWSIEYNGHNLVHTVKGLVGANVYKFRVKSSNQVGSSIFSSPVSFGTESAPPQPPSLPTLHPKGGRKTRSIKLQWEPPINLNGSTLSSYVVLMSTCATVARFDSLPDLIREYNSSNTWLEITGLSPGTTYFVRLCAVSNLGRSNLTGPPIPFTTLPEVPSKPGNPQLLQQSISHQQLSESASSYETIPVVSCTKLSFNWSPSASNGAPITQYSIWMTKPCTTLDSFMQLPIDDTTPTGNLWQEIGTNKASSFTVPPTLLKYANFVAIRVQATNSQGVSEFSSPIRIRTENGPPSPPTAPLNVSRITASSVELSWKLPALTALLNGSELRGFNIELQELGPRGVASGKKKQISFIPLAQISVANKVEFSYSLSTNQLLTFTPYQIRYQLVNTAGASTFSPFTQLHTLPPLPPSPTFLTITDEKRTANSVALAWQCEYSPAFVTANKQPLQYLLQVSLLSQPPMGSLSPYSHVWTDVYRGPANSFNLIGLLPAQHYLGRVAGITPQGRGEWSQPLDIRTRRSVPAAPTALQLVTASNNSIRLRFQPPASSLEAMTSLDDPSILISPVYRIEYKLTNQSVWIIGFEGELDGKDIAGHSSSTSFSYRQKSVKPLVASSSYDFRVSVSNEEGFGALSEVLTVSTTGLPAPPPTKPTILFKKEAWTMLSQRIQELNESSGESSFISTGPPDLDLPILLNWSYGAYELGSIEAAEYVHNSTLPINYVLSQRMDQGSFQPIYSGPISNFACTINPTHSYSFAVTCENMNGVSKTSLKCRWEYENWLNDPEHSSHPTVIAAKSLLTAMKEHVKPIPSTNKSVKSKKLVASHPPPPTPMLDEIDSHDKDELISEPLISGVMKKRAVGGRKGRKKKSKLSQLNEDEVDHEDEDEEDDNESQPTPRPSSHSSGPPMVVLTPLEISRKKKEARRRQHLFLTILLLVVCVLLAIGSIIYIKSNRRTNGINNIKK